MSPVRQAAVRGIAALKDPQLVDALLPVLHDPDAGVRKSAVETVANLGATEQHLEALWRRLTAADENDESIRQAAWRGVLTLVTRQPVDRIEQWISRLPSDMPGNGSRLLELLQALARKVQESDPSARHRLGLIRVRIAAQHEQLDQFADAVRVYGQALEDLRAAQSPHAGPTAVALLRLTLRSGLYTPAVAAALNADNPESSSSALWSVVFDVVHELLAEERPDAALAVLEAVSKAPLAGDQKTVDKTLSDLRALALQAATPPPTTAPAAEAPAPTPASQPTSQPATDWSPTPNTLTCRFPLERFEN